MANICWMRSNFLAPLKKDVKNNIIIVDFRLHFKSDTWLYRYMKRNTIKCYPVETFFS